MQLSVKQATVLSISTLLLGLSLGLTINTGSSFRRGFDTGYDTGYVEGLTTLSKGYKLQSIDDCNIKIMTGGVLTITSHFILIPERKDSTVKK